MVLVKVKVLVPPIDNLKVSSALSKNPVSPSPNAIAGLVASLRSGTNTLPNEPVEDNEPLTLPSIVAFHATNKSRGRVA